MQQWIDAVQAEVIKLAHENQEDEYERGMLGGLSMGLDAIKVNKTRETATAALESQHELFKKGYESDRVEFDRGMRDGLKRVLELYQ